MMAFTVGYLQHGSVKAAEPRLRDDQTRGRLQAPTSKPRTRVRLQRLQAGFDTPSGETLGDEGLTFVSEDKKPLLKAAAQPWSQRQELLHGVCGRHPLLLG